MWYDLAKMHINKRQEWAMADSGEWKEGLLMMMAALSVNDMRVAPSADEAASLVYRVASAERRRSFTCSLFP